MKMPLITAHAGCMNTQPNTIQSVLEGIKNGANIIEVDVRATCDGIPILIHDDYTKDLQNNVLKVEKITFKELISNEKSKNIITLEEVLDLVLDYDMILNLDMKSFHGIEPMVKLVENKKMIDRVILSGCVKEKALYMYNNHPEFRVLYGVNDNLFNSSDLEYEEAIKKIYDEAISMSCCGINIEYKYCKKELIDFMHSRFMPVAIWTVDDVNKMETYIKMNVYSITTNNVKLLAELIHN